MGFFRGLDTEAYDRSYSDMELIRRIIGYFKPHKRQMFWVIFFISLVALAAAAQPIIVSQAMESLQGTPTSTFITYITVLMTAVGIGIWLVKLDSTPVTDSCDSGCCRGSTPGCIYSDH